MYILKLGINFLIIREDNWQKKDKQMWFLIIWFLNLIEKCLQIHLSKKKLELKPFSPKILHCLQFSSVTQLCLTLCDPMSCITPGLPVHHQLPELTKTHVHWVCDAIQPSHPLSSPSPTAPNPSQHQSLFQWVNSSHEVAKVLEFQL